MISLVMPVFGLKHFPSYLQLNGFSYCLRLWFVTGREALKHKLADAKNSCKKIKAKNVS